MCRVHHVSCLKVYARLAKLGAQLLHEGQQDALTQRQRLLTQQLGRVQLLSQPCHPVHV